MSKIMAHKTTNPKDNIHRCRQCYTLFDMERVKRAYGVESMPVLLGYCSAQCYTKSIVERIEKETNAQYPLTPDQCTKGFKAKIEWKYMGDPSKVVIIPCEDGPYTIILKKEGL